MTNDPAFRGLIAAGMKQHDIAHLFQVNPGRVAEALKKGESALETSSVDGIPVLTLDLVDVLSLHAVDQGRLLYGIFIFEPAFCGALIDKAKGRNRGNRKFKTGKILNEFIPAMQEGAWHLNGETLKFSDDAMLVDGQNRCAACARAGSPFASLVVFGVPRAFFASVDVGKPRSAADLFTYRGAVNAHVAAGGVRWIMVLLSATPHRNSSPPPQAVLDYYDQHIDPRDLQHSIQITRRLHANRASLGHSLLVGLHYVFWLVDSVRADAFFNGWADADPWFRPLNQRLDQQASRYGGRPVPQYVTQGNVIQAWNVWRKKQVLRTSGRNSLSYESGPFELWSSK